jgi:hypothetical protein
MSKMCKVFCLNAIIRYQLTFTSKPPSAIAQRTCIPCSAAMRLTIKKPQPAARGVLARWTIKTLADAQHLGVNAGAVVVALRAPSVTSTTLPRGL